MAENPLNFVNYGMNSCPQTTCQQQPQITASMTAISNQSVISNVSWATKMHVNSPVSCQGNFSAGTGQAPVISTNLPSYLQQPNAFTTYDSMESRFYGTNSTVLSYDHTPSCSVTNHRGDSNKVPTLADIPNGPASQFPPYPFSTTAASFSSSISQANPFAPATAVPPQISSFPSLPLSDAHPNPKLAGEHYLYPSFPGIPPVSESCENDSGDETSLHHNFSPPSKSPSSQPSNNHCLTNGNYPGGMGSLQQEFARMNCGMHQARYINLMQERNLLKYGSDCDEIALPPTVCNPDARCSPSIFRCTLNSIPQTQELLKKSRLPFGLTLQPFRDMKNLNIIQTSTIVRCRYCRTYINPYIYLPDSRHWKCSICYRVNDLPDDFNWDPATKSFGEPTRRPEIRNATVEFIAPSEYMLRPPQPAVYVFVMDVSQNAIETGYLYTFTEQLLIALEQLPGDERTMLCFIAVDSTVHFFQFRGKSPPRQLIIEDFSDMFLPVYSGLLINLRKNIDTVRSFVQSLPTLYESNSSTACCLGAALTAAREIIADIGGRITVLLTVIPDVGPGALKRREDPNQRAASEVPNLCPASDYYKRLALECTGNKIAVDLFLLNNQYTDLSTLADVSKFSTGCIYHFPNYHMNRNQVQVKRFQRHINRYLVRKIGFEAVLRIRCTKGLSLHTFYGHFFVRSTDLLEMANVNPDSAVGVQVQMEEDLVGINTACFQAAVLYTSSKGDRRIRIHTLCLPVTKDLPTVFTNFDVKCAVSLLAKMAVNRCLMGTSLTDSREAMVNAVVDAFGAYNSAVSQKSHTSSVLSPSTSIRLFPLYVLGMLKHRAFTAGQSVKLDNRVAALLQFYSAPLEVIDLELYPALYQLNYFTERENDPPRLHLSFEHINRNGVYLMDTGSYVYIYISSDVGPMVLKQLFDVNSFGEIDEEKPFEPRNNPFSERVHSFLRKRSVYRTLFAPVILIREDSHLRDLFTQRLIDDRTETSHSYIEFLHHIRQEMQK